MPSKDNRMTKETLIKIIRKKVKYWCCPEAESNILSMDEEKMCKSIADTILSELKPLEELDEIALLSFYSEQKLYEKPWGEAVKLICSKFGKPEKPIYKSNSLIEEDMGNKYEDCYADMIDFIQTLPIDKKVRIEIYEEQ